LINGKITVNDNDTYKRILKGARNPDGSMDKALLLQYKGVSDWMSKNLNDKVTRDPTTGAIIKIESTCESTTDLSTGQCNDLCKIFPEGCSADQAQRCGTSQFRYTSNGFHNKEGLDPDKTSLDINVWIIIIFICIAFVVLISRNNIFRRIHKSDDEQVDLLIRRSFQ
jgi:hypothetical protein